MIKEKDIKVGTKFCWDGEHVKTSEIDKLNGYYLHLFDTDVEGFHYAFSNKSKYPTTFTIVGLDKIDNVECAINDGEMSIVMGKDDIIRFAHIEGAEAEDAERVNVLDAVAESKTKALQEYEPAQQKQDSRVSHPSHYTWLKELCGIEVIDIARHLDFDMGNALKYLLRAGHKKEEGYTDKEKALEDLKKAAWYLNDKIKMLENEQELYRD